MVFACYTRKSVYVDHSDSTANQARMAREYIEYNFPGQIDGFMQYEDEGISGATVKRPGLENLIRDIQSGMIDALVVYAIDRLSRDVKDFSNIYDILVKKNVKFISINERIDTSTPAGEGMMYMSAVFAQMERKTIATRIYDNMIGLSDDGWWVGGNPPFPYRRVRVTRSDGKHHVTIEPIQEHVPELEGFFRMFIDNQFSLQGMETYLRNNNYRTINGKLYQSTQIYNLLTMPYCVPATPEVYDHYREMGCIMSPRYPRECWDGKHGVMIYCRTTERNRKHENNPKGKWRVCIGRQAPCIDADLWLRVQKQFGHNTIDKKMKHDTTLLKGILRCSCGRLMGLARKSTVSGEVKSWYYCQRRMRTGVGTCDRSQLKVELLDNKVLEILQTIAVDPKLIDKYVNNLKSPAAYQKDLKTARKKSVTLQNKIENLAASLSKNSSSAAAKYIIKEMETLDSDLSKVKHEIHQLQAQEQDIIKSQERASEKQIQIADFVRNIDNFTIAEKNKIVKEFITKCVWDGKTLFISF